MSYCRFSDDSFRSDIYCYQCAAGVCIHVARQQYVGPEPRPQLPHLGECLDQADAGAGAQDFLDAYQALMDWTRSAVLAPIELPYAGAQFVEDDAAAAVLRLEELQAVGFRVPEHALAALRCEAQTAETFLEPEHTSPQ